MSKTVKKIPKRCVKCNKSFSKVQEARDNRCVKCDTSAAGTWALSYLAQLGYIKNSDTIENGYAYGESGNKFLGLKNKTQIYVGVDKDDMTLFHLTYQTQPMTDEDEDEYGVWWDHPSVKYIHFRIDTLINIV